VSVKRIAILAAVMIAIAALGSAAATAAGGAARLQLHKTSKGTILVNSRGFTIYAFAKDSRNHDACAAIRNCLHAWPPVTTTGEPIAGTGVKSGLIGTIKLKSGARQVTYAGHPLYTYIADTRPAETTFINILQFGARWPALDASGHEVK
jgi:predicted lipoprotein with Yx(FWY)xxD motif